MKRNCTISQFNCTHVHKCRCDCIIIIWMNIVVGDAEMLRWFRDSVWGKGHNFIQCSTIYGQWCDLAV